MQRKVKKGCGRARNMPVKDMKRLFTTYTGCHRITAGKLYPVSVHAKAPGLFEVVSNDGFVMLAQTTYPSAHFKDIGRWEHPFK